MPPSEQEARTAVESLFDKFDGVEISELSHEEHKKGYEHKFDFEITYPKRITPSEILGQYNSIGGAFKWLKVVAGMNEVDSEGMMGYVRCYYRD